MGPNTFVGRVLPRFPISVVGVGGIVIDKTNGIYTFSQNPFYPLGDAPDDGTVYGRQHGLWISLAGNVGEAPNDGAPYARKDKGWIRTILQTQYVSEAAAQDAAIALRITDAPNNVNAYVRKGVAWVVDPIQADAPSDGKQYARASGAWTEVVGSSPGIPEAPTDGKLYGRKNSAWAEVIQIDAYTKAQSDALYLKLTGGTLTGDLTIAKATPGIIINKAASGQSAYVRGLMNAKLRWNMLLGDATAETGVSNIGSEFQLYRYDDAGSPIGSGATFSIARTSGYAVFSGPLSSAASNVAQTPQAPFLLADTLSVQSIAMNTFVNSAGSSWISRAAGFTQLQLFDATTGALKFQNAASVAANAGVGAFTTAATLGQTGDFKVGLNSLPTQLGPVPGIAAERFYAAQFSMLANNMYLNPAGTQWLSMGTGTGGMLAYDKATVEWYFQGTSNSAAGAGVVMTMQELFRFGQYGLDFRPGTASQCNFKMGGVNAMVLLVGGGLVVFQPTVAASMGVQSTAGGANAAGIFGYAPGSTVFGGLGYNVSNNNWSVYGSASAFLGSGTWQTSDARLKNVVGELTPNEALQHVMAVPVKRYTHNPLMAGVQDAGEEHIGWLADDVETVIPIAITQVGVPGEDILMRAALRGETQVPSQPEDPIERQAAARRRSVEEPVDVKALNLYPMVAELWAAVQGLSQQVQALQAAATQPA